MVICLQRGADLQMAQLMPLPLTVSCFSKIQTGLPFWYRLTRVVPEKGPLNGCVCVSVTAGGSNAELGGRSAQLNRRRLHAATFSLNHVDRLPAAASQLDSGRPATPCWGGARRWSRIRAEFKKPMVLGPLGFQPTTKPFIIVSRSYDKLMINREICCKSGRGWQIFRGLVTVGGSHG